MIERKLICGKPHKKVPCSVCKGLIWVRSNVVTARATCNSCAARIPWDRISMLGREENNLHESQYSGKPIHD